MPKRKSSRVEEIDEKESKNKLRRSTRLERKQSLNPLSKKDDYAKFIESIGFSYNDSLAESLFITIKDEIPIIDEKYNLIDLISNSGWQINLKRKWISNVVDKCKSKVSPDALFFCAYYCSSKTLQLLLSRGADPNALTKFVPYECECRQPMSVLINMSEIFNSHVENLYWLIIYGGDVCVSHMCNSYSDLCCSLRSNSDMLGVLKDNLANFSKYASTYSMKKVKMSNAMKMALKYYRMAIKEMRNEVMNCAKYNFVPERSSVATLIPDLYEIVFGYLAWPRIIDS